MKEQSYTWDITLLEQLKQTLSQNQKLSERKRTAQLEQISFMIKLVSDETTLSDVKKDTLIERIGTQLFGLIYDEAINEEYNDYVKESQASHYLRLLTKNLQQNPLPQIKEEKSTFSIQEVTQLLEEFLNWLPSKMVKEMLEVYYHNYFSTHFCYKEKLENNGSAIYYPESSWPFIVVKKETFIKTFLTLVHEMGHVLFWEIGGNNTQDNYKKLFSEISGLYLEQLAISFAIEKGYKKEAVANACFQYHNIEYWTKCCRKNMSIFPFLHDSIITQDYLKEIYSYLASTELYMRYQKDYEKQLYDFIILPLVQADNLEHYLKKCYFTWREDEFQKVKAYRNELHSHIQKI